MGKEVTTRGKQKVEKPVARARLARLACLAMTWLGCGQKRNFQNPYEIFIRYLFSAHKTRGTFYS